MDRITVKTSVQADIDKVWDYWTKPKHITNWNFATDEWTCPSAKNDLQPNGTFSWRMEAKDGSIGFDFEGTYEKIVDKELISYKMSDGRKLTLNSLKTKMKFKSAKHLTPREQTLMNSNVQGGKLYLGILKNTLNRNKKTTPQQWL